MKPRFLERQSEPGKKFRVVLRLKLHIPEQDAIAAQAAGKTETAVH
jgi:hypothetical protein